MATTRVGLTAEGSLYEALARGNKDAFFFKDHLDQALNPFENRYDPVPPIVHELRRIPPLNGAEFGRSCEFEFETAGDIFVQPTVIIDLPTWYPAPETLLNKTQTIVETSTGNSIGYTNGIAYFLFSKIQIYQDKILLLEFSGDTLWASRAARGTLNSAYLENGLAGWHDGSAESIAAAATPGRLRLELPFIGGPRRGFPSIAMRQQSFKLRLTLRPLEEILESSVATATAPPSPWEKNFTVVGTTPLHTFQSLARTAMTSPSLQLETRHIYTDGESQIAMRSVDLEIPFQQLYENHLTFGPLDYAPIDRGAAVAPMTNRIDARHPASRLFWYFRSKADLRAGRRWKVTADNASGEFYANESLIIAGRDRETLFSPFVWNDLTYHAKEERDPGRGFGEMAWDMGAIFRPDERQPEGAINFTPADRPTLYTELIDNGGAANRSTEMTVVVDSWALYRIERDRGFLKYGN
jgi:hypothetical protein